MRVLVLTLGSLAILGSRCVSIRFGVRGVVRVMVVIGGYILLVRLLLGLRAVALGFAGDPVFGAAEGVHF